jgi:hypothetical protein
MQHCTGKVNITKVIGWICGYSSIGRHRLEHLRSQRGQVCSRNKQLIRLPPARRPAWINDLRGVWLESGVNSASSGSPSVERLLARLPEEVCLPRASAAQDKPRLND